MMNVMMEEELYDRTFVERWVYSFRELKGYVRDFTPEKVEKISWGSGRENC